ncbi:hypothetical protein C0989_006810 [Termitomyces sp. Mn162]|nr:hypothetical protein C0989_006810 [Termitomyces sp. Mn162]
MRSNKVLEDIVHHHLKGGQAVGESKEHNKRFKQSPVDPEGSLPFVSLVDAHVVVAPLDVQLSEVLCTLEVIDELGDEGEGVAVLHGHSIKDAVVLGQSEQAILLFDEED